MTRDKPFTESEMKEDCLKNGMSLDEYQRAKEIGYTDEEIYNAVHSLLDKYGTIYTDEPHKPKRAAEYGEARNKFVWKPYIPEGDYTVLMADGGTGKTIFCCGVIAGLSTGTILPGETKVREPCVSLIISAEDRGELLKQRLASSGADLNNVYILDCMSSEGINFTDGEEEFIQLIRDCNAKLVIVDPWHAFLGADVDINRVNAVRPVFQRLANIAKDCECGLVLVSHVNKRSQGENANNAATGSTDFINAARSAMRVIFSDENDGDNTRIVVHTKSNYAAAGDSVKFQINDKGGCIWTGFSEITRRTLEEAARWRKKPGEVIAGKREAEERNQALIEAICNLAVPGKVINISYDEMKEQYGEDIFGYMQPKRAVDCICADLWKNFCIDVKTGKRVKHEGIGKNGFSICLNDKSEEIEQMKIG